MKISILHIFISHFKLRRTIVRLQLELANKNAQYTNFDWF